MKNIFSETFKELEALAKRYDGRSLISYSGGKDSMVVLDMASRVFSSVIPFYMYIVPGLRCVEAPLQWARDKYGIEIQQYPHWLLSRFLQDGIYCNPYYQFDKIPRLSIGDINAIAREDTGYDLVMDGQRKADGPRRGLLLSKHQAHTEHPLKDWNTYHVYAYMKIYKLEIPDSAEADQSGIDLSEKTLLWLHEKYPDDLQRMIRMFPFCEVPIYRRKYYGSEIDRTARAKRKKTKTADRLTT